MMASVELELEVHTRHGNIGVFLACPGTPVVDGPSSVPQSELNGLLQGKDTIWFYTSFYVAACISRWGSNETCQRVIVIWIPECIFKSEVLFKAVPVQYDKRLHGRLYSNKGLWRYALNHSDVVATWTSMPKELSWAAKSQKTLRLGLRNTACAKFLDGSWLAGMEDVTAVVHAMRAASRNRLLPTDYIPPEVVIPLPSEIAVIVGVSHSRTELDSASKPLPTYHASASYPQQLLSQTDYSLTPTDKLHPLSAHKRNVALVMSGTFCPIHRGHVEVISSAKHHLEAVCGWHVVGAYLSPSNARQARKKLGIECIDSTHRRDMAELVAADYDWLMVDRFLVDWKQGQSPGAAAATVHLAAVLKKHYETLWQASSSSDAPPLPEITLIPVCGADALPKLRGVMKRGQVVCVVHYGGNERQKAAAERELEEALNNPEVAVHRNKIIIVRVDSLRPSSTLVRRLLANGLSADQYLHPAVVRYHVDNRIAYAAAASTSQTTMSAESPGVISLITRGGLEVPSIIPLVEWHRDLKWTIDGPTTLGTGAVAKVYPMQYRGREVAVKVYEAAMGRRKQTEAFYRELQVFNTLGTSTNGIVSVLGAGKDDIKAFVVLERASTTMWSLVQHEYRQAEAQGDPLPTRAVLKALRGAAEGLVRLAETGIIHRDLTLNNMLVFPAGDGASSQEQGKLIDFGHAKFAVDTGWVVARGSLRHYAPEALVEETKYLYDSAADVYSFGVAMWEAAHASLFFGDLATSGAICAVLDKKRPDFHPRVRPEYAELVRWCWSHDRTARPPAKEVLCQLIAMYQ